MGARAGLNSPAPAGLLTTYTQVGRMFGWKRSERRANLAVERLENRLNELTTTVEALLSANKRLELEWTETYDKVRHQMSRMARRGDLQPGPSAEELEAAANSDEPTMDPISAGIHARRNRSFLGG